MSDALVALPPRIFYVRTSDRISFKRCRRKWNWQFAMRGNRTSKTRSNPLWLGTGFHFAMEDRHGWNRWPTGAAAFEAYYQAWLTASRKEGAFIPDDHRELAELTHRMLSYYETWMEPREELQTFWQRGEPQVEVRFEIELPVDKMYLTNHGYDKVMITGTIDRVVEDELGRLWLVDYKTAKAFNATHFDTDPQISTYCWAASILYPHKEIAGFIYQQHKKSLPDEPKFLSSTKMFSISKQQATTRPLYRNALLKLYGSLDDAPAANIEFLNYLAEQEGEKHDAYIRRDYVYRNAAQMRSIEHNLHLEVLDMLDANLRLYPNPTRDCDWDCDFKQACINMDDGGDWEFELENSTIDREEADESWRQYLHLPEIPNR